MRPDRTVTSACDSIRQEPRTGTLPLSINQEARLLTEVVGQWRGHPLPPFHVICAYRLFGSLDAAALARALRALILRHESLRCGMVIPSDVSAPIAVRGLTLATGQFRQFLRDVPPFTLEQVSLRSLEADARDRELRRIAERMSRRSFDYDAPPLLRAALVHCGADEHVLIVTAHHLIADGWSLRVLLRDLAILYNAEAVNAPANLPDLKVQYVDYAAWQRRWIGSDVCAEALAFFNEQWDVYGSLLPTVEGFPFAHGRPTRAAEACGWESSTIRPDVADQLRRLARDSKITLFVLVLAALHIVQLAYTGRSKTAVMGHFANRPLSALQSVIGWFVHSHIIGIDGPPEISLPELLRRARTSVFNTYRQQAVPEALVWADRLRRAAPPAVPLYVSLDFDTAEPPSFHGLTAQRIRVPAVLPGRSLQLSVTDSSGRLGLSAVYSQDVFESMGMRAMLRDWQSVLSAMVDDPTAHVGALAAAVPSTSPGRRA